MWSRVVLLESRWRKCLGGRLGRDPRITRKAYTKTIRVVRRFRGGFLRDLTDNSHRFIKRIRRLLKSFYAQSFTQAFSRDYFARPCSTVNAQTLATAGGPRDRV